MPPKKRRSKKKNNRHIFFILTFVVTSVFLFIGQFGKEDKPGSFFDIFRSDKIPEVALPMAPYPPPAKRPTAKSPKTGLPLVAIVIDDLGTNRKSAQDILNINSPLTLSILPKVSHSVWVAEEGHRRGRDIIVHLPMEATKPLKLGPGGLYTRMTKHEIIRIVKEDIRSVPHSKGASNHMGSAFTQDRRAMGSVLSTVKGQRHFFLDSLTAPGSVAFKLAKAEGLQAYRRDVFLDNTDNLRDIEIQWNRLVKIAREKGQAIAIGHPKKNTILFLKKVLKNNKQINVVPITELIPRG